MNNLARLRELMENYKLSIGTSSYEEAKQLYESAAREMLPGLVAVAEASKRLGLYDYSDNDSDFVRDCSVVEAKLIELDRIQL